jgi:uncharacterized protein YrrD
VVAVIKYLDLKGSEVVSRKGNMKGFIDDCIIDFKSKKICSAVLKKNSIINSFSMIAFNGISNFNEVIVYNGNFYNIDKIIINKCKNCLVNNYLNKDIIDTNGIRIGNLMDMLIDEKTGYIKALICSRGFFDDIFCGRKLIMTDDKTTLGTDKIIINDIDIDFTNNISLKNLFK